MTIKQIIEKAVEGGWRHKNYYAPHAGSKTINAPNCGDCWCTEEDLHTHEKFTNEIFLDPKFWQALGKAMKWGVSDFYYCHSFIDHLWKGGTPESFFTTFNANVILKNEMF